MSANLNGRMPTSHAEAARKAAILATREDRAHG